jgi:hypothetical protein
MYDYLFKKIVLIYIHSCVSVNQKDYLVYNNYINLNRHLGNLLDSNKHINYNYNFVILFVINLIKH